MYLGVDIGGTKTLLAVFDNQGKIVDEQRFLTSQEYASFITELAQAINNELASYKIQAGCCAVAGTLDRESGKIRWMGNLPWLEAPLLSDLQHILPEADIWFENDAKLAGLHEALWLSRQYRRVLYLALGTGVGVSLTVDGRIDLQITDPGGRGLKVIKNNQPVDWDDVASGRALVKQYGKKASELNDPDAWQAYAANVALGLKTFIDKTKPEVVVVGGGVGAHFAKFAEPLRQALVSQIGSASVPPLLGAQKPEEAVIYGCYDYIVQQLST